MIYDAMRVQNAISEIYNATMVVIIISTIFCTKFELKCSLNKSMLICQKQMRIL